MAKKRRKLPLVVEEHGVAVRIFERGGTLYVALKGERVQSASGKWYTRKDTRSLGHSDVDRAIDTARELAKQQATSSLLGTTPDTLTLGQLQAAFTEHRLPLLSATRQRTFRTFFRLWTLHWRAEYRVVDLSQHEADAYTKARQSGKLRLPDYRSRKHPSAGTIRNELQALSTVCNWACTYRMNGKPLLTFNPMRAVKAPTESNPRRPVVTPERYAKLAAVAGDVDPSGQFRMMLELAWRTGRRINAILHLRASDVLLSNEAVLRAFAEEGQDEQIAREWGAALRWRAEWDKKGYLTFSPLPDALRHDLTAYTRRVAAIGDAWLFPDYRDASQPTNKARAHYLLDLAEKRAGLPKMARGGWHAMRRGWATLRRSLPAQDVAFAGGWRDLKALQAAYQHADSKTVASVVNFG